MISDAIVRKAQPKDIPGIIALGLDSLEKDAYENLIISKEKVEALAIECVSATCNFAWVVEKDGKIVGSVCAIVTDMMFYELKQASVLQIFCKEPVKGVELLREFMKLCESRPAIKMVCFTLECNADPRIGILLNRLGLKQELPVYLKMV